MSREQKKLIIKREKKRFYKRLFINYILSFLAFFLLAGVTTTVSFLIFLHAYELPINYIKQYAVYTFFNLIFIAALFGLLGTAWRKYTVEKPIEKINNVLIKIRKGDYSSHLKRRNYSDRFATIVNTVNLMATELSSLDNLKISLISNISHELKTPISVINNYATLLQDPTLTTEKQVEYAKAVAESSKKMNEFITNILKLNQLENQNIPSDMTDFDVSEQFCECLLDFEDVWEAKNIDIVTDIEENITVKSNQYLMNIVWNNLLSNAFKFTPEGGTVTVKISEGKKYASVSISDTGCGIPEDQIELIFDKFYQCDTSRGTEGNGLGLALVKRIINITDCIIKVESKPGEGSKFTVKIPKQ